jgi:hypothetical protein
MLKLFATKLQTNIDTHVLQIQTTVNVMIENKHKQKEIGGGEKSIR